MLPEDCHARMIRVPLIVFVTSPLRRHVGHTRINEVLKGTRIMSQKISSELAERLAELQRTGSTDSIPVIVTLRAIDDQSAVKDAGLSVQNVLESVPAVSGSASSSVVNKMAQLEEVELIEFDGEMRAL